MSAVAVVPVKLSSDRVKDKNFRDFFAGDSLFDLLLKKLQECSEISRIYVSSNAEAMRASIEERGCEFLLREDELCNNHVPWSDVIFHVAHSIPVADETPLAWCHTTSPLFNRYTEALRQYQLLSETGEFDGLVSVARLAEFVVNEKRQPLNYSWGPWHRYSQHLDKLYMITGALFVAQKQEMMKNRYVISKNPAFFEVSKFEALDVDTPYDFELAKLLMNHQERLGQLA